MGCYKNNYLLQFDFIWTDLKSPVQFTNPEEIIAAYHLEEIDHCMQQIEQATNDGKYVAGYISYEATYAFQGNTKKQLTNTMPLLWFGVFTNYSTDIELERGNFTISKWNMSETKNNYMEKFQQIMSNIRQDTFEQINYTVPFHATFTGDPFTYYVQLKQAQQANFNAYLQIENYRILSTSPELFFHLKNNDITVKPMKGTIHRGKTYEEDVYNRNWLTLSNKNKLENEMISNLMKTELKKIANPSTVAITKQFEIEQYPTVYQMTSTVTGKVSPQKTITDIFKEIFPCGSISGIPKKEAIDFISEIEHVPREVYCGAIGYITPNKEAIFNVPIRTVTIDTDKKLATYHAGGAITAQSNPEEEYKEMLTKTKVLHLAYEPFQLLETLGLHDGKFTQFTSHLERLQQSAHYFNFKVPINEINIELKDLAHTNPNGSWIVRLLVQQTGDFTIRMNPLSKNENSTCVLAKKPINKENIFFYHKTTNRSIYNEHRVEGVFDVLLWNELGEITEFTIGNVVVEMDRELLTPPVECGLLSGTYRNKLIHDGRIKEAKIYKEDLTKCSRIWLINSVRHWVEVSFPL